MAGVTVKVEGLDELRKVLRRIADRDLTTQLKTTNKNAAGIVVRSALPNVPAPPRVERRRFGACRGAGRSAPRRRGPRCRCRHGQDGRSNYEGVSA